MNEDLLDSLLTKLNKSGSEYNIELISDAFNLANEAHSMQKRSTGEPYIIHPVAVAGILTDLGMDSDSIAAALLHDADGERPARREA
ncbi:MAG: HD domain-containing protein, partial [Acutalibacteraceae bacterium]